MGRPTHSRTLGIWANGERVGRWTINRQGGMELQYDLRWIESTLGRPLSLSLPFTFNNDPVSGPRVANYFDGLLPDSDGIRRRTAARFGSTSIEPFDLLTAIGRDCVGAVQLLAEDEQPTNVGTIEAVPIDDDAIERHLLAVVNPVQFGTRDPGDDFRISLAGAQEKDAYLWWQGQWMKPRGATPTTHIFKLPMGLVGGKNADFRTSVDNEWICLRLLKAYGLDAANAEIATFGRQRVLVVERFDRRLSADGTRLLRLMQEDFCQATGKSPLQKYESHGGPGLIDLFGILQQSSEASKDMRTVMASQILFWMLSAPDGHAKNFSIQLLSGGGRFRLTKLYDVMSALPVVGTGANQWPRQELKLAMSLLGKNRHYTMHSIQRRHFNSTAQKVGYAATAEPVLQEMIARTPAAIAQVQSQIPSGFSQEVADRIFAGLTSAAAALDRQRVG